MNSILKEQQNTDKQIKSILSTLTFGFGLQSDVRRLFGTANLYLNEIRRKFSFSFCSAEHEGIPPFTMMRVIALVLLFVVDLVVGAGVLRYPAFYTNVPDNSPVPWVCSTSGIIFSIYNWILLWYHQYIAVANIPDTVGLFFLYDYTFGGNRVVYLDSTSNLRVQVINARTQIFHRRNHYVSIGVLQY